MGGSGVESAGHAHPGHTRGMAGAEGAEVESGATRVSGAGAGMVATRRAAAQ